MTTVVQPKSMQVSVTVPGVGHAPTLAEPVVLTALQHFLGAGETTRA